MNLVRIVSAVFITITLVAGVAFAAGLSVTSDQIGSGGDQVGSCQTSGLSVSFGPPVYDSAIPGYKISNVTISGIDQPECKDAAMKIVLSDSSGAKLSEQVFVNIDGDLNKTFTMPGVIPMSDIEGVDIVIIK